MSAPSNRIRCSRAGSSAPAPDRLRVTTWNLGYAGLGEGSDFVVDGGSHWFPPSRKAVVGNRDGITDILAADPADVFLLQEIARAGTANYWTDLKHAVECALPRRASAYLPDIFTRWLPFPLRMEHGLATYARTNPTAVQAWPLPVDGDIDSGWLKKRYAALVMRLPSSRTGRSWTLVNLHLAAFDPGAELRRRQAAAVFERAQQDYAAGALVVIGGDWNLRLAQTDFPHTTADEHLAWLADFTPQMLPTGWTLAADPATPSVRTDQKSYVAGENYTAVIDGFVVSPNVAVRSVAGVDLGFRHSDHQPVQAVFEAKP